MQSRLPPRPQGTRRVRIERSNGEIRIFVGPGADAMTFVVAVLFVPWCAVANGGAFWMLRELIRCPPPLGAAVFCGVIALLFPPFCAMFAINLAWKFVGQETIIATPSGLTLQTKLLSVRRSRFFASATVSNLRLAERKQGHGLVDRRLAFESRGRSESSRSWLSRDDARQLLRGPIDECIAILSRNPTKPSAG